MPTVTSVFTVDYVAQILDEHPDLIHAIISNEDNPFLSPPLPGAIVYVITVCPNKILLKPRVVFLADVCLL